jgi:hypothetical protein
VVRESVRDRGRFWEKCTQSWFSSPHYFI